MHVVIGPGLIHWKRVWWPKFKLDLCEINTKPLHVSFIHQYYCCCLMSLTAAVSIIYGQLFPFFLFKAACLIWVIILSTTHLWFIASWSFKTSKPHENSIFSFFQNHADTHKSKYLQNRRDKFVRSGCSAWLWKYLSWR